MYDLSPSTYIQHVKKNVSSFFCLESATLFMKIWISTLLKFHKLLSKLSYRSVTLVLLLFFKFSQKLISYTIQEIPNPTLSRECLLLMRSAATVALKFDPDELFYFATPRIIREILVVLRWLERLVSYEVRGTVGARVT